MRNETQGYAFSALWASTSIASRNPNRAHSTRDQQGASAMNAGSSERPKVFISYARVDGSALAEELALALEVVRFNAHLDSQDIVGAEDWERRLDTLIQQADIVLFILTPCSVQSERCAWEVARAEALAKRIVPVIGAAVDNACVPSALQRLNYIDFTAGHSFARSLGHLADALRLDIAWIREHTRLGELARRWQARDGSDALLLRGDELAAAQTWAAKWTPEAPPLTESHRAFIAASLDAEARRKDDQRRQNEAMARANQDLADALRHREEALVQVRRRTLAVGGTAVLLSAGIVGMAWRAQQAEQRSVERRVARESLRRDISGQVVAYAASMGQAAMDSMGPGGGSPYSSALLAELDAPNVSLWTALSQASVKVMEATKRRQRPFISSDMNGDLFLMRPSPTRKVAALLIASGRFGRPEWPQLEGVYRDVKAWNGFLVAHGFKDRITLLEDPPRAPVLDAISSVRMAAAHTSTDSTGAFLPVGLRLSESAPAPHGDFATGAPPDTLLVVFYSGMGFRVGADLFLAVADTGAGTDRTSEPARVANSVVPVSAIEAAMRESAAASVLILDTNFF
jgi:hypothetical protein